MAASQPMGTIVILAGGTGGHVFPALAVAAELRERGFSVHWVGTNRGLESRVVPAAGYPLHTLGVQGIRGKGLLYRLQAVLLLLTAMLLPAWAVAQATKISVSRRSSARVVRWKRSAKGVSRV